MTVATDLPAPSGSPLRRLSSCVCTPARGCGSSACCSLPLLWLVVLYFAALFALLSTAFFSVDSSPNAVVRTFTLSNFQDLFTDPVYPRPRCDGRGRGVRHRDLRRAGAADGVLHGQGRQAALAWAARRAGLTPLWASYLVKVYAWQAMVQPETGVIAWMLQPFGLSGPGYGIVAVILTLSYLWLPYMILPIYAGLERLPDSLLDASGDLGARPGRTFRSVVLPLIYPSIVAGSIFTFSLSLGDYIAVQIVGGKTQMLGNIVYQNYTANNLPFAAAVAVIPVAIMLVYLALVRRTGALEKL